MTERTTNVLAIAGSLRKASASRAVVAAAAELATAGVRLTPYALDAIPLYNGDLDVNGGPEPVRALKQAIAQADALLLVTPEYNYGIPGVLKNAIDWASRPGYQSVLAGKPVAIVGVGHGSPGGARAVAHLKDVMLGVLSPVLPVPDLCLPGASQRIGLGKPGLQDAELARLGRILGDLATFASKLAAEG
jgi:chromate reductase